MSLPVNDIDEYYAGMNAINQKSYVYILSNKGGNVIYIGSTDDLKKRIYFHKNRLIAGFTKKYNVDKLVYFEEHDSTEEAFIREKQIKGYRREKKNNLIEKMNSTWADLYKTLR